MRTGGDRPAAVGAAAGLRNRHVGGNDAADSTRPNAWQAEARRLRRQRLVQRLYRLGPRAVFELVDEIGRRHGITDEVDRRLAAFAALDAEILAITGGDKFPAAPMRAIGGAT